MMGLLADPSFVYFVQISDCGSEVNVSVFKLLTAANETATAVEKYPVFQEKR